MFEKHILIGYLTRDPESRVVQTSDGRETHVTDFGLATNKAKAGGQKQTTWWKITVWGRQAETVAQYLKKGRLVAVDGEITPASDGNPRTWEASDGTTKASYELVAHTVRFLGGGNGERGNTPQTEQINVNSVDEIPF